MKSKFTMILAALLLAGTGALPLSAAPCFRNPSPPRLAPDTGQQFSAATGSTTGSDPVKAPALPEGYGQTSAPALSAVAGNYITDNYNINEALVGMYAVTIATGTGNSVTVSNLLGVGKSLTGTYDDATGVISIAPGQVVAELNDGTILKAYYLDLDAALYYGDRPILASVSAKGIITTSAWIAVAVSGPGQGGQIASSRDVMYKMNATATHHSLVMQGDDATQTYGVHFSRPNNAQVLIKNFYGYGYPVTATCDTVGNMTFPVSTIAWAQNASGSNVSLKNYHAKTWSNDGTLTYTLESKATPAVWNGNTITLSDAWGAASGTGTTSSTVRYDFIDSYSITLPETFAGLDNKLTLQGSGTEADPYLITSAADLRQLSIASNYNAAYRVSSAVFNGVYFKQTTDIDMAEVTDFEPIGQEDSYKFSGIYDGAGHSIANLTVTQTRGTNFRAGLFGRTSKTSAIRNLTLLNAKISSTSSYAGGIAGYAEGEISGITVSGIDISAPSSTYIGGIVGMLNGPGKVSESTTDGKMTARTYVGGIIGNGTGAKVIDCSSSMEITRAKYTETAAIFGGIAGGLARDTTLVAGCSFTGAIKILVDEYAGGIVGNCNNAVIERCWFGGQIMHQVSSQNPACIGGIAGRLYGGRSRNNLSTGILQSYATPNIGGIAGVIENGEGTSSTNTTPLPEITNSLSLASILCDNSVRGNEIVAKKILDNKIENAWFDNQATFNYGEGGLSTSALTDGSLPAGFDESLWSTAAGSYPMLAHCAGNEKAILDRVPFTLADGETAKGIKNPFSLGSGNGVRWYFLHNNTYQLEGNGLKIEGSQVSLTNPAVASDTLVCINQGGYLFRMYALKSTPDMFPGNGTEAAPYQLASKADFDKLFDAVDNELHDFTGVYFKVTADIDFSSLPETFYAYSRRSPAYGFNGTIDGQGHTLGGINLYHPTQSADAALIRYTGPKSEIKNLVLDASNSIIGGTAAAGLVAVNTGTLRGIVNHAEVTALSQYAGGITAMNQGVVAECFNDGAITVGQYYAGGIAGVNDGTVDGCQNSGIVKAEVAGTFNTDPTDCQYAGGIAGRNRGSVTNSLNQANVYAYKLMGGITGSHDSSPGFVLEGNVNTGVICNNPETRAQGALAGYASDGNTPGVKGNVYDSQYASNSAVANRSLNNNPGLTTALLTSGLPVEGLAEGYWTYAEGKYPVLTAFAAQPSSQHYAATTVIFNTDGKVESRFNKLRDAIVRIPAGATATLRSASRFTLSSGILSHTTEGRTPSLDTLTVVSANGLYISEIPVLGSPRLLTKGDGTLESPWLIETPADWNSLAEYGNTYKASFEGEYFRLEADLDFAEAGFTPIYNDEDTYFQGFMDGNSKTISGITISNADLRYGGIFSRTGNFSKIHDLTIAADCSFGGKQYMGALAGETGGEVWNVTNRATVDAAGTMGYHGGLTGNLYSTAWMHHCTNYGNITGKSNGIGGLCGTSDGGARLDSCTNYGTINGKGSTGGIMGSSESSIRACENFGIVATVNSGSNAGGIVGYMWPNNDVDNVIENCTNHAGVTSASTGAGGIVGYCHTQSVIRQCTNLGAVEGKGNNAGGIVGQLYSSGSSPASHLVEDCENRGNVHSTGLYVGGVVGSIDLGKEGNASSVRNVRNYGTVKGDKYNVGGIAGYQGTYTSLEDAFNFGPEVAATTYNAGGIVGNGNGFITRAANTGAVSGTYALGGIIGGASTSTTVNVRLTDVFNIGAVASTGTTLTTSTKIGGIVGTGNVKIYNAFNIADLSGYQSVGGIVGLPVKGTVSAPATTVVNAYHVGRINVLDESKANTCGYIHGDDGKNILYCKYENCFFDTQMAGTVTEGILGSEEGSVTGLTTAQLVKAQMGEAFVDEPQHYPALASLADMPVSRVASAAVMLVDGEHADQIQTCFLLSLPEGVEWTSPDLEVSPDGNVTWDEFNTMNPAVLTATHGDHRRTVTLGIRSMTSGIESATTGNPVATRYYTLDGIEVAEPTQGTCIKVTIYEDGTRKTEKTVQF